MTTHLQLAMAMGADHRNQYLFSDHYLNELLPRDPRWEQALPEAEEFWAWVQDLYTREQGQLADYNESQLEEHWFKPILEKLGHVFERQAGVPGLNTGVKHPDYVFFPDEATRQVAAAAQSTDEYTADALAVGEVKRWDTALGKKRRGGGPRFEDQNPSWQIDYYVRATDLDWGILSNGRLWRLLHRDTSQRLSIYYEVDLVDLLGRGDAGAMRYFALFFRQAAFRPDAQGRVFLDDALAASNAYAVELEEDLEENVYRALERLMQGFLDLPANGLGADDLREIYDNSLYLLYRLLFILYGESRGLLPMHNEQYREQYSLEAIKGDIVNERAPTASLTTIIWGRLQALFHIINGDDAELNRLMGVPRYNGGLFDPQQHPFLDQKAVGDQALGEAIDLLSRRATEAGREFVDYRSLGVRHLGSIYEGLLEYQPRIAHEPMVAVGGEWIKASESPGGDREIEHRDAGQVYLETDRGERKATGSYYTPQYIVEYIVEHTLGPLVDEAAERVKESLAKVRNLRKAERQARGGELLVDEILDLKCLDPAMGSGHFLVEATEFLALALATDPYVETETPAEEDLTHWKRRVVERCIYGVDKNPLAVELAKLSLWLVTVAADRPLSFLDHHLKCGDSLIGARVDDLGEVPPVMLSKRVLKERQARYEAGARQANLFETRLTEKLPVVMGRILEITEVESKDYDTVRAKEAADQAVRQLKAPFQAVADLWTSAYFGNEFINGEYDQALMHIGQPEALLALDAVQRARAMAEERRFFHWELAFPEVFYDRHGRRLGERAGFDAVVSNPPYVDIKSLNEEFAEYLFQSYSTMHWRINIFAAFLERALDVAGDRQGKIGFIIPTAFLTQISYAPLRELVLNNCWVRVIVRLPNELFGKAIGEVKVDACIVVADKDQPFQDLYTDVLVYDSFERIGAISPDTASAAFGAPQGRWAEREGAVITLTRREELDIIDRMQAQSLPLEEYCEFCLGLTPYDKYAGHTEEQISEKVFHANSQIDLTYKRLLRSGDVRRYSVEWNGEDWIKYGNWLAASREQRFFTEERVMVQQIIDWGSLRLFAGWTDEELYNTQNQFNLLARKGTDLKFVLAILNSRLMSFYHRNVFLDVALQRFQKVLIKDAKTFPIRRIEFTTPADEREQLVEEAKERAEESVRALAASGVIGSDTPLDQAMLSQAASPALAFVEERLAAKPEQADVVHDLLAHLAERMIEMHRQKQARVEGFWLDLEGAADDDTFAILRHKGKQERTLWRKAEACRPFVGEESHSTRRLDESLAWNEGAFKAFVKALAGKVPNLSDLVQVYRRHHPAYHELVSHINATDRLIDLIIYRLYGLGEEEVKTVEGSL